MQLRIDGMLTTLILLATLCAACSTDSDDGKASDVMRGNPDSLKDAATPGVFDQDSAELALTCRSAVLTETEAQGFQVKVTDAKGNVPDAPGLFVRLSPSTGTVSAAKPGGAETDSNGEVSFAFVAPHFDFTTSIVVEASVIGAQDRVLAKSQCSFKVVTQAFRFVEPEKDSAVRSDRATPITIEVLLDGLPASCDDGGGMALTLAAPSGAGIAQFGDTASFERELCVDLSDDGRAVSAQIRGGTGGGKGKLRASLGEASQELSLQFIGAVAAIQLTADASELELSSGANLTVKAIDDVGQGVPGVAVTLAVSRCAAAGCTGGESVSPESAMTDKNGEAKAAYFAGDKAGAAQLTAAVKSKPTTKESVIIRVVDAAAD